MGKRIADPWDFIAANANTRSESERSSAGTYWGRALSPKIGSLRDTSTYRAPKDKTAGFKKPITQA